MHHSTPVEFLSKLGTGTNLTRVTVGLLFIWCVAIVLSQVC